METELLSSGIEGSLKYAEFLQKAIFPKQRHFDRVFDDSFILFKPLQYLSGDFYWITERNGLIYVLAADCAGHGIPGAILSILTYSLFDYVVLNKQIKKTHKIVKEVDKRFIESFSSVNAKDVFDNDWVDVSFICIEKSSNTIYFTGAKRDILLISDKDVVLVKGGKYSIGGWKKRTPKDGQRFKTVSLTYKEGDALYMGTDGFQDQFGGTQKRAYKKARLHNFLQTISGHKMSKQKFLLENELASWMGDNRQIDDICIIGLRL